MNSLLLAFNMEAFNVNFVGVIQKHPVLYNQTLPEYARKDVTDKAWREVAKEVNLSVRECKERWKNLRTAFVRGIKASAKTKKQYYLHEAMQFILPFTKTGNLFENTLDAEISDSEEITSADLEPFFGSSEIPTKCSVQEQSDNNSLESPEFEPSRKKRKIPISERETEEFYFTKKTALCSTEDKRKSIQAFLKSLVPDLLTLTDPQLRSFKRRTLLIIDEVTGTTPLEYECETSRQNLPGVHPESSSAGRISYEDSDTSMVKVETPP